MKKLMILLVLVFLLSYSVYGQSVFQKNREVGFFLSASNSCIGDLNLYSIGGGLTLESTIDFGVDYLFISGGRSDDVAGFSPTIGLCLDLTEEFSFYADGAYMKLNFENERYRAIKYTGFGFGGGFFINAVSGENFKLLLDVQISKSRIKSNSQVSYRSNETIETTGFSFGGYMTFGFNKIGTNLGGTMSIINQESIRSFLVLESCLAECKKCLIV